MKNYLIIIISSAICLFLIKNFALEKLNLPSLSNNVIQDSSLPVQMESKYVTDRTLWGQLKLNKNNISSSYQVNDDQNKIINLIESYHRNWLDGNTEKISKIIDDEIIRFRNESVTYGIESTINRINNESRGERPSGYLSSMSLDIDDIYIDSEEKFAIALYSLGIRGGARWEYSDLATIFQIFRKFANKWVIIGHVESLKLDNVNIKYPPDSVPNRRAPFTFDFVYPVKNLKRAIAFYSPLLGSPDISTSTSASFKVRDSYFELSTESIDSRISIDDGHANGYAVINVNSLKEIQTKINNLLNLDLKIENCGLDQCLISEDLSGNITVWKEHKPITSSAHNPKIISAQEIMSSRIYNETLNIINAWATNNYSELIKKSSENSIWIDDAYGIAKGPKEIKNFLQARWKLLDRGPKGIDGDIEIRNFKSKKLNNRLLTYLEISLKMKTRPKKSINFFQMQIWKVNDQDFQLEHTFIAEKRISKQMPVNSMDYTAYPVNDLGKSGHFYKILFDSEPYRDENWFGFWSTTSVFGLVGPMSEDSWKPTSHKGNGYADLSIRSANEVYEYLQSKGSTFPVIEAINDTSGIDSQPGYNQILTIDSEGNLINFSEYLEY
mgnify:FL=1